MYRPRFFFSFTHINQEKKNVTTNDDVNAVAWIEGASPFDCCGDIVGGGGFGSVLQQILSLPFPCGQQNLPSPRSWNEWFLIRICLDHGYNYVQSYFQLIFDYVLSYLASTILCTG